MAESSGSIVPVAVIMAVYEGDDPASFDHALQSMVSQDYELGPIRIYLCEDGPVSAGIEAVIETYRNRIHKLLRNVSNAGLAVSLNRLLRALEDEAFVFRMDSDDYALPHRISRQVHEMRKRSDVDILGTAIAEVDGTGNILKSIRYPKTDTDVRKCIPWRTPIAHPTVCFRRTSIERFGLYPDVPVNQDIALWFECLRVGLRISNIDDVLVHMTVSDGFFRRRGVRRAFKEYQIWSAGVWRTHGFTWRLICPMLRLGLRLLPPPLIGLVYRSGLR